MHSEAYRKSIAVKRESHNPQPALPPSPTPRAPFQSSILYFPPFHHLLLSPIRPVRIHRTCTPTAAFLWCLCLRVPYIFYRGSFASFTLLFCPYLHLTQLSSLFCLVRNPMQVTGVSLCVPLERSVAPSVCWRLKRPS